MLIGQVSVHDIEPDDLVRLHELPSSKTWCLSIGGVDFYSTRLDVLHAVFRRVSEVLAAAQPAGTVS